MDENMKLIMAEFAKINTKLDSIDTRVTGLENAVERLDTRVTGLENAVERLDTEMTGFEKTTAKLDVRMSCLESLMTGVGTVIKEAELDKVNIKLGMLDFKLDKLQDNYERLGTLERGIKRKAGSYDYGRITGQRVHHCKG